MAPTLVLVPGSFSTPDMYDPVVLPLREKGYSIHVLDPPCYPNNYKKGTTPPSMYDDAKFISDFVKKLVDESGENVVVLAHSYGGTPASQALENITKSARQKKGQKGGVTHIAYLTAVVPAIGENLATSIASGPSGGTPPMEVDEDGWLFHLSPSETAALCFNSLSATQGTAEAARFGRHSSICFADALTYAGYKDVPASWFFCEDDSCVCPEVQQAAIDRIEESWKGTEREGGKLEVKRVKCDHVPLLSARAEVEEWMEGLLK